jgi:hypothetical protein
MCFPPIPTPTHNETLPTLVYVAQKGRHVQLRFGTHPRTRLAVVPSDYSGLSQLEAVNCHVLRLFIWLICVQDLRLMLKLLGTSLPAGGGSLTVFSQNARPQVKVRRSRGKKGLKQGVHQS